MSKRVGPGDHERSPGLNRAGLVSAALRVVQEEGLEALTMRALADELNVKAASLYWHLRDRSELLELLAESLLDSVPITRTSGWRQAVVKAGFALSATIASQRDAARILLEVPEAFQRSDMYRRVKAQLETAGLQPAEAAEVAFMAMVHVVSNPVGAGEPGMPKSGAVASIAVDSGSRGVVLRHGTDMETLIRIPHDPAVASPAIVRGDTVKVRRLRGAGHADIELNASHSWRFQIQGPTWNTVLDGGALDVREIKLDGGATKVECFLPRPHGVVPIIVSGGVVGVNLHRPPGVAVTADISSGAVRLKLDAFSVKAVITDVHWESEGASSSADRYELRISGGAVQVTLDEKAMPQPVPRPQPLQPSVGETASALQILLDGVESRVASRRRAQGT